MYKLKVPAGLHFWTSGFTLISIWRLQVLPQGSVKAKPSAAIGAALGPHLVLPNGNVSGPRACAPVEAFELPGSVAKGVPAPSTATNGGSSTAFDYQPGLACSPVNCANRAPRPVAQQAASQPGARPAQQQRPPSAAPKPPKAKPRPLFEGEERKRGPAGRTSMYKVHHFASAGSQGQVFMHGCQFCVPHPFAVLALLCP